MSTLATIGNQPIFLFAGMSARQIVLVAGRNLLVEKDVTFSDFRVNDAEFEARRARARERAIASCSVRLMPAFAIT